jgi:hypothetical protein
VTLYGGETVQIRHRVKGYDGETLNDSDVVVTITIFDLDGVTVLVDNAPMDYTPSITFDDGSVGGWVYLWDTPAEPGAYLARCNVAGTGLDAWEYKTIRLRRSKG